MKLGAICMTRFLNDSHVSGNPKYLLKQKFPKHTTKLKVMLEVFFDAQALIHYEFLPQDRTVTKESYKEIHRLLRDAVRRKRPDKGVRKRNL